MSNKIAYMVDTNVLNDWLSCYCPSAQSNNQHFNLVNAEQTKAFMESNANDIYIPDLVWAEFVGVLLHKDMDVSQDFWKFKRRFRDLQSHVDQIDLKIINQPHLKRFTLHSENIPGSPFIDGAELVRDICLINHDTFKWLSKKYKSSRIKNEPYKGKLLDGMDASIVFYLSGLAKRYPDKQFHLLTRDYSLFRIFSAVKKHWVLMGFSQNTDCVRLKDLPET